MATSALQHSTLDTQLEELKALKRLVKQHDLQLREAENHLQPQFTDVTLGRIDCNKNVNTSGDDTDEVNEILQNGRGRLVYNTCSMQPFDCVGKLELIQQIEATIEDFCQQVENTRRTIEEDTEKTTVDLREAMTQFLYAISKILVLEDEIREAKERQKREQLERSQDALSDDETFKKLLEERKILCEEEQTLVSKLKQLDSEKVVPLTSKLQSLTEEKHQLQRKLKNSVSKKQQELQGFFQLDEDAADLLQILLQSPDIHPGQEHTIPTPQLTENMIEGMTAARSALRRRSSIAAVQDKKQVTELPFVLEHNLEDIYEDVSSMTSHEKDAVKDVVELRRRDYRISKKLEFYSNVYNIKNSKLPWAVTPQFTNNIQENVEPSINELRKKEIIILAQTLLNDTSALNLPMNVVKSKENNKENVQVPETVEENYQLDNSFEHLLQHLLKWNSEFLSSETNNYENDSISQSTIKEHFLDNQSSVSPSTTHCSLEIVEIKEENETEDLTKENQKVTNTLPTRRQRRRQPPHPCL